MFAPRLLVAAKYLLHDTAIALPHGWEGSPLICIGKIRRRHLNAK